MASSSSFKNRPYTITLLPLLALALATIAAFFLAIQSNLAALTTLWTTPCSAELPLGRLPHPLCFAVHFFQAAHATPRARLEQAAIVSFLAGLATITAVERARVLRQVVDAKNNAPASGLRLISRTIIANLTVPWLLYNLALGALAWQGIIIPAFLLHRLQHQRPPQNGPRDNGEATETETAAGAHSLAIPLSITLGLLLPASVMLLHPTASVPILLFLLFPLWIALTHRFLRPLTSNFHPKKAPLLYAPPIIASTLAHLPLLFSLISTTSSFSSPTTSQAAASAAIHILELDHAAIFLAALYWILLEAGSGTPGVLTTLTATVALGPGAGVCIGWLCRRCEEEEEEEEEQEETRPAPLPSLPLPKTERWKGGKATGSFFGALPG